MCIRDSSVESVLIKAGYADVAKGYILYRKQREKIRNLNSTLLDYKEIVDSYVKVTDWRVKENSTVTYSVGGLILSNSGAITANYWLSEIYDEEIGKAHKNADIHIHDLSMLTGYCAGWSLKQLIQEGLGGVTGRITSAPAKHLSCLLYTSVVYRAVYSTFHVIDQCTGICGGVGIDKTSTREKYFSDCIFYAEFDRWNYSGIYLAASVKRSACTLGKNTYIFRDLRVDGNDHSGVLATDWIYDDHLHFRHSEYSRRADRSGED